jgi:Xylose isomerase-like TIM barrel
MTTRNRRHVAPGAGRLRVDRARSVWLSPDRRRPSARGVGEPRYLAVRWGGVCRSTSWRRGIGPGDPGMPDRGRTADGAGRAIWSCCPSSTPTCTAETCSRLAGWSRSRGACSTSGMSQLGRVLADEFGVRMVFHSHTDSHVGTQEQIERFLEDTDPATVGLCLDTGHVSYYEGDNVATVRKYPDRVDYVHLKQVDHASGNGCGTRRCPSPRPSG